jgi:hypothetical protein
LGSISSRPAVASAWIMGNARDGLYLCRPPPIVSERFIGGGLQTGAAARMTMRRRGNLLMNDQNTILPPATDATIELELTSEQLLDLSQAAERAEPFTPAVPSPQSLIKVSPASRLRRWHPTPIAKVAAAVATYAAFAWWSASQFSQPPQPPAMAVARATGLIARPTLIASSQKPAVRAINPFDATEVFEFPAGTTHAESRAKVAQILLQRARERQSQSVRIRPAVSLRTASLYRSP